MWLPSCYCHAALALEDAQRGSVRCRSDAVRMILICRRFLPFTVNMRMQTYAITQQCLLTQARLWMKVNDTANILEGQKSRSTVTGPDRSRPAPDLQQIDTS